MKFLDQVDLRVSSGDGGKGVVAWRREKYVPKGGPSGGDGGDGGSVYVEADENLYTLMDLSHNTQVFAGDGEPGGRREQTGASGEDKVIRVPPGTVVKKQTGEILGEVVEPGQRICVAEGGQGGRGNAFFKSSTNQAPRESQPGEPGEERDLTFELKLMADVGLVGFPNAGKSTLVSSVSAAEPEVADYPFTTLTPQLGMVYVSEYETFVMADIPGIIEDAHEGKGLGLQFLRHIERTSVLLFVIPITSQDLGEEYEALLHELESHEASLLDKPRVVALSKIDILAPDERVLLPDVVADEFPDDVPLLPISAVADLGLDQLKYTLFDTVHSTQSADAIDA
ncbi:GTP-binding protein [Salinibacter ruber]|uniref:GTPase Obg n=1 Tax=Salinibacter ruber TaxID=146919 RepID=A0A9X2PY52_9BACT|nr:GTPase ObgE [Salinibacter ruber]MCS3679087.1 GTP-binding protein [Salinibacter ruber]MCS3682229.1 GTP-binding protein [Salinibacter ruber]